MVSNTVGGKNLQNRCLCERRWYALFHQDKREETERVRWLSFDLPRSGFCQEERYQALYIGILQLYQMSNRPIETDTVRAPLCGNLPAKDIFRAIFSKNPRSTAFLNAETTYSTVFAAS